jgi:alpha/beta superfamily hydrolase
MAEEFLREIPGPIGPLEALLERPQTSPGAAAVFAHPHPLYGGTMHTKGVYQSAKALARIGVAVLRFNFRGVGRSAGRHDEGPGEMDDFRAALEYIAVQFPGVPLWAAGFSFGAWAAMTTGALDPRIEMLLGVAPPVDRYDFGPVKESEKPKFLIHGEFDELVPLREVKKFYGELREPKDLVVIDAADHLFTGRTLELGEVVEDLLRDFVEQRAQGKHAGAAGGKESKV